MEDNDFFVELQNDFLNDGLALLEEFEKGMLDLESGADPAPIMASIFRVAHSIKGGAAAVGFTDLGEVAHKVEDLLSILRLQPNLINPEVVSLLLECGDVFKSRMTELRKDPQSKADYGDLLQRVLNSTEKLNVSGQEEIVQQEVKQKVAASQVSRVNFVKVDDKKIEGLLDFVGEIVVLKNQILYDKTLKDSADPKLRSVLDQLDRMVRDLYDKTLSLRLTPLSGNFQKIQRIVRDVSLQVGKPVELHLSGEDSEVERTVNDALVDPLMHMVRNAIDHGIESPEERAQAGKSEVANVWVSAEQVGGSVKIVIRDDGRGIQRDKVLSKAIQSGLVDEQKANEMSDNEVYHLLFAPGFSTAAAVTDLSGRGVGLDVVKSNITKVGGRIEIESQVGVGTTFRIVIPLSTAIIDGVLFEANRQAFLIPTQSIKEIVQIQNESLTHLPQGGEMVKVRSDLMPIYKWNECQGKMGFVVEEGSGNWVMGVDGVRGQTQVVVKPLQLNENTERFMGAAVMGDGSTVLIVNPKYNKSSERSAS